MHGPCHVRCGVEAVFMPYFRILVRGRPALKQFPEVAEGFFGGEGQPTGLLLHLTDIVVTRQLPQDAIRVDMQIPAKEFPAVGPDHEPVGLELDHFPDALVLKCALLVLEQEPLLQHCHEPPGKNGAVELQHHIGLGQVVQPQQQAPMVGNPEGMLGC